MTQHRTIDLDIVPAPSGGLIGLTPCPGIIGADLAEPPEARIESDLACLRDWGAVYLLTLMEEFELIAHRAARIAELGQRHFGAPGVATPADARRRRSRRALGALVVGDLG